MTDFPFIRQDSDGDGLDDDLEEEVGTNPYDADSDNDGLLDGEEVAVKEVVIGYETTSIDLDPLGFLPAVPVSTRPIMGERPELRTNPLDADSDDDGLSDGEEVRQGRTDPNHWDTDRDGLGDREEHLAGADPTRVDSDGDGLGDGEEVNALRTDPTRIDTDGDGWSDFREARQERTNPRMADTDRDGVIDSRDARPLEGNDIRVANPSLAAVQVGRPTFDADAFQSTSAVGAVGAVRAGSGIDPNEALGRAGDPAPGRAAPDVAPPADDPFDVGSAQISMTRGRPDPSQHLTPASHTDAARVEELPTEEPAPAEVAPVDDPVAGEALVEEPAADVAVDEVAVEAPIEDVAVEEAPVEEPVVEEPVVEEPVVEEPVVEEPVAEELALDAGDIEVDAIEADAEITDDLEDL